MTLTGDGTGLLILSGENDYTGGTFVSAGTLNVTSAGALPSGSSLTVGAGGALLFASPAGSPQAVPEPSTLALFAVGIVLLAGYRRWRWQ